MRVHVLFFGQLKDILGRREDQLELPPNSTLLDVLSHYGRSSPKFQALAGSLACSLNQEYAGPATVVHEGDEIGLLPPVSGGKGGTRKSAKKQPAKSTRPASPLRSASSPPKSKARASATGNSPPRKKSAELRSEHCAIIRAPIFVPSIRSQLEAPQDGAALIFEGVVRNNTRGRSTLYLDYEAYESMAINEMERLAQASLEQFPVRDVRLVHRLGRLAIGETSVVIGVASAHRGAAFEACRWLIDWLKKTVPIWKKEHFQDGAVWADGEPFPEEVFKK